MNNISQNKQNENGFRAIIYNLMIKLVNIQTNCEILKCENSVNTMIYLIFKVSNFQKML